MNKSESKYFNTARCMDEALIALLEQKDLEYITVKEICEKAGVNRSTFYLHYETIGDLLNEAMESVNRRFLACFAQRERDFNIRDRKPEDLVLITEDYLRPYLQFIRENKNVYRASFRNPREMRADARFKDLKKYILEPILKKFGVREESWNYYVAYYIEGTAAIIKEWLKNDCQEPVETMITIMEECIRPDGGTRGRLHGEEA